MPFIVPIEAAREQFPQYEFVAALTPSEQKAAFHVKDSEGRDLCLKIIAPDYEMDRLSREIRALQSIDHPNIVQLREYTYSSSPGYQRHYIIEEFVEGKDLAEILGNTRVWPRSQAAEFFSDLCNGLAVLNAKRLVHRDLKPTNIRVRPNGSPVIIDFGLARHLDQPDITLTKEGAAFGTPLYFAPEQFVGTKHDIQHRTDLFAVGILLYQALFGRHPFWQAGMSYQRLSNAVCTSSDHLLVPEFCALPRPWQLLMSRLLEKEQARRPHDAGQVSSILKKINGL
jgi:serine/threonine-protein kinase